MVEFIPNPGKKLIIEVEKNKYVRLPIKTRLITPKDNLLNILEKYLKPHLKKDDIVFISERIVAITQSRAWPIKDISPSWPAKFLSKFVRKSPYGIGIGSPWTMELAIREAGYPKMFLGMVASALSKPFGLRGGFYWICGKKVASIDGPCSYTIPPYNKYAKLGPLKPNKVAKFLKEKINQEVIIIDANDLGVAVLGKSSRYISDDFCKKVFRDNPLGQSKEQTPLCIVRKTPLKNYE